MTDTSDLIVKDRAISQKKKYLFVQFRVPNVLNSFQKLV